MSHQFHIFCDTAEDATHNFNLLSKFIFQDDLLFSLRLEDNSIFGGCRISTLIPEGSQYNLGKESFMFDDVFYLADNLKSGMHHPHGVLWIYENLDCEKNSGVIPLEQAFEKILETCNVTQMT